MIAIPNSFPHHKHSEKQSKLTVSSLQRLDIVGALLFLALSICFVAALQEASVAFPWRSGVIIALLVVSGVSLVAFVLWERFLTIRNKLDVPVLSWDLATRKSLGLFMHVKMYIPCYGVILIVQLGLLFSSAHLSLVQQFRYHSDFKLSTA